MLVIILLLISSLVAAGVGLVAIVRQLAIERKIEQAIRRCDLCQIPCEFRERSTLIRLLH
jgi:hypothetical protein